RPIPWPRYVGSRYIRFSSQTPSRMGVIAAHPTTVPPASATQRRPFSPSRASTTWRSSWSSSVWHTGSSYSPSTPETTPITGGRSVAAAWRMERALSVLMAHLLSLRSREHQRRIQLHRIEQLPLGDPLVVAMDGVGGEIGAACDTGWYSVQVDQRGHVRAGGKGGDREPQAHPFRLAQHQLVQAMRWRQDRGLVPARDLDLQPRTLRIASPGQRRPQPLLHQVPAHRRMEADLDARLGHPSRD